jgi:hypothetical protein
MDKCCRGGEPGLVHRRRFATQARANAANPPSSAPAVKSTAAERLKQVKELYDQGLINKEDYDRKVKEILNSL